MKTFASSIAFVLAILGAPDLEAAECNGTCVPPEDMQVFVRLLKDQKCRAETPPALMVDPIMVVTDHEGRIYGTGSDPKPFTVHLNWCNYVLDAKGQVSIVAAKREEPTSGFRFRPKATIGYLPVTAFDRKDGYAGLDAGLLLEPVFFSWANLNAYVGARSVGAGFGLDITRNMGFYLGYAVTWGTWQHNPHAAVSFALW